MDAVASLHGARLSTILAQDSMTWHCTSDESPLLHTQIIRTSTCKVEHTSPIGCVLLGMLKAVEQELAKRDLLGLRELGATPLWFVAETERNVFLWRNGKSISDYANYSFWIDIKALIRKRRSHLARHKGFNPFIQVTAGSLEADAEHRYLELLEELADTIFKHAEVLSHASESIRSELAPNQPCRTVVLLPPRPPSLPGNSGPFTK